MPLPSQHAPTCEHDLDSLDLPDFGGIDPLIWAPPHHDHGPNNGSLALDLDATASFLSFTRPDFFAMAPSTATGVHGGQPALDDAEETSNLSECPALHEHALLFSKPTMMATLLDESRRPVQFAMSAELGGMFFVAEDIFSDQQQADRPELTCYRRNLWQCLGDVTFSRQPKHLIDEHGNELPIRRLVAAIVTKDSLSGTPTELVSTSCKTTDTTTGNAIWVTGSPSICPLTFPGNPARSSGCISLKMAWNRLQFKHSTANNGRRKGPQQHYIVQIHLLAESNLREGSLKVAEIKSSPVIVRGRSPRNFESQKEVPIQRQQRTGKRPAQDATTILDEPADGQLTAPSGHRPIQLPSPNHPPSRRPPSDTTSWPPRKRVAACPDTPVSSHQRLVISPESTANTMVLSNTEPTPTDVISLSLFDDGLDLVDPPDQVSPVLSGRSPPASSTDLDVDDNMYYEYFPLGADDWMSSIEAVYCPHVNHYAHQHIDAGKIREQGRPRRYFTTQP